MLSVKLQNIFFSMILLFCLAACGQTGDLYLPGSDASQNDTEENSAKQSKDENEEETKN